MRKYHLWWGTGQISKKEQSRSLSASDGALKEKGEKKKKYSGNGRTQEERWREKATPSSKLRRAGRLHGTHRREAKEKRTKKIDFNAKKNDHQMIQKRGFLAHTFKTDQSVFEVGQNLYKGKKQGSKLIVVKNPT